MPVALMTPPLLAQQTIAPSVNEPVGPVRGENSGNYNVVQSWELGYRFSTVGGNDAAYRSVVNFGNGIRLLGSSLTINSKDGKGKWFDEIVLTTQGLGNDPYESAVLRARKNRIYQYDMSWRLNDYYNPGLVTSGGLHAQDTENRWQDHELTIFPQGKYRLRVGYSRTVEDGPALSSVQLFDTRADAYPIFSNVKREFNEYRVGGDVEIFHVKLTALRRWAFFKEDTPYFVTTPESANDPANPGTLSSLQRSEPQHGETPGWLVNLFTENRWFAVNGRFVYNGGRDNFALNESAVGIDRFGANQNRLTLVSGDARRMMTTADGSISVFLTKKLTLVNNSSFTNTRMDGNNSFQQYDLSSLSSALLNFQFLGIRLFTNSTDLRYQFTPRLGVYGGYQYSDRLIRSNESAAVPGDVYNGVIAQQSNHQNVGLVGVNWAVWKALRLHLEGELGQNDNPFYPISLKNFHAISGRLQYRAKRGQISGNYKENYNNNSITLTAYSSKARTYSANGTWAVTPWVSLDGTYSFLHLDTIGGAAFFAGSPRPTLNTGQVSLYVSNIHAATLGIRFAVGKRVDLFAGYSLTRDTGDGRSSLVGTGTAAQMLLYTVQTFPLWYQSPMARVSVRLHEKLRWNFGYQYYGYKEEFGLYSVNENFRANTGYTSLLWSF
jgi:hypothetical protein